MNIKEGATIKGKVTGIKPYGAFIKVEDNFNGLVHISEFSDGYVRDISDFVEVGDLITVRVLEYDEKSQKLKLSYKSVKDNKRKKYREVIKLDMGFDPLKELLPTWIEERKRKD